MNSFTIYVTARSSVGAKGMADTLVEEYGVSPSMVRKISLLGVKKMKACPTTYLVLCPRSTEDVLTREWSIKNIPWTKNFDDAAHKARGGEHYTTVATNPMMKEENNMAGLVVEVFWQDQHSRRTLVKEMSDDALMDAIVWSMERKEKLELMDGERVANEIEKLDEAIEALNLEYEERS